MTTIYLDTGALMVAGGTAAAGSRTVSSDASRMVGHLLASGHDVVLIGDREKLDAARAALPVAPRMTELESNDELDGLASDAGGWLVSDSADRCTGARNHRRLKTVLVGAFSSHDLAHRPADRLARSLADAVLDILATEAMPGPTPNSHDGVIGPAEQGGGASVGGTTSVPGAGRGSRGHGGVAVTP